MACAGSRSGDVVRLNRKRMNRTDLTQIDDFTWEIPASFRDDMRVPVRILASEALLDSIIQGAAIEQAIQTAQLPGLVGHLVVMPDVYSGQGAPVGIVAISKWPVGALAPGAIGHDINTGVACLGQRSGSALPKGLSMTLPMLLKDIFPAGWMRKAPST